MPFQTCFLNCCLLLPCMLSAGSITAQAASPQLQPATAAAANDKILYNQAAKAWHNMYCASATLYICIAVTDPAQERKPETNGLEVWIDPRGKKYQTTCTLYPLKILKKPPERRTEGIMPPPSYEDAPQPDSDGLLLLEKQVARQYEMRLMGFKEELNGVHNNFHPSGIRVMFSFVKDTWYCQAPLPLNALIESADEHTCWSVGLTEKGHPLRFYGSASLSPGEAGDVMPSPGLPPAEAGEMRIFEDNII